MFGTEHLKLELELTENNNPAENIADALLMLEKLLRKKNKTAVLLLDEFQEIGTMHGGRAVEGAIRHAAQETEQLALIFSGSNPHLLQTMFEDERRPLYKLCRKLVLDRIHEEDYRKHLNNSAKIIWDQPLSEAAFKQIMLLTERHPYYVNYLCDELCGTLEKTPSAEQITRAWKNVIEEERSDLLKDFFSLTDNQQKLLMHIANDGSKNLFSSEVSRKLAISASSISRAIAALLEKDYIEKTEGHYRIIVPAFFELLKEN
jgi:DNA-binding IclR family transcriptional regulator